MNQTPDNLNDCESYELAISAMIDGELSSHEKTQLGEHLLRCENCRNTVREFQAVTDAVWNSSAFLPPEVTPAKATPNLRKPSPFRYAAGAGLLIAAAIAVFVLLWTPEPAPATTTITAQQVIVPMQELDQIGNAQERDQQLRRRVLELELRNLQLQVNSIKSSDTRNHFQSKLDAVMKQVKNR